MHQRRLETPVNHYDAEKDSLYLNLRPGVDVSDGFSFTYLNGLTIDTDWSGRIAGVEIDHAKQRAERFFDFHSDHVTVKPGLRWTGQLIGRELPTVPMERVQRVTYFIESYLVDAKRRR